MAVTQYIGARYVPIFADPAEWTRERAYEALTIVLHEGNSYTSRQSVPVGIDITNTNYWLETGNYNAQVEAYRREVLAFDSRITQNTDGVAQNAEDIATLVSQMSGDAQSGLKQLIDAIGDSLDSFETEIDGRIDGIVDELSAKNELVWIGDSWSSNFSGGLPNHVAGILDMTLHNYAVSGSGWFEGTTFQQQAQSAISDTSINKNLVTDIVIYGGTNDFSHGNTNASAYTTPISNTCAALKEAFPRATIHLLFNVRYRYGNTEYKKLNPQVQLWKQVCGLIATNSLCVTHLDSAFWIINPDAFMTDGVHPTEGSSNLLAARTAKALRGGYIEFNRALDAKTVSLASNNGQVTGTAYIMVRDERLMVDMYLNVSQDQTGTVGVGAGALSPFEVFTNSSLARRGNNVGISLVANGSSRMAQSTLRLHEYENGDDVFYAWDASHDNYGVESGSYNGHGEYIIFV